MMQRVLTLICLFIGAPALAANTGAGAAELTHGYFCAMETVATQSAKDTVSGTVNLVDGSPAFIGPGPDVPARIGIGFGVKVRPTPGMAGNVTVHVQHPPMGPNGVTRQNWNTTLSGSSTQYLGYTFEHAYEVVPGPWIMSASANGRLIYSVSFSIVDPRQMPWIECGRQIPLS